MGYTVGRLIDHVGIRVRDFPAARTFYRAVFEALGRAGDIVEREDELSVDEVYVGGPVEGSAPSRVHLCFQAPDRATVERFHAAAIAAGGRDNGAAGLRSYHPGYYAAFVLDPDGNNIEAMVDERVTARSAAAVELTTS